MSKFLQTLSAVLIGFYLCVIIPYGVGKLQQLKASAMEGVAFAEESLVHGENPHLSKLHDQYHAEENPIKKRFLEKMIMIRSQSFDHKELPAKIQTFIWKKSNPDYEQDLKEKSLRDQN